MTTNLLERLLAAAEAHGAESEPEHEVGDLQQLLHSCWKRLTPAHRRAVFEEHRNLVEDWLTDHGVTAR